MKCKVQDLTGPALDWAVAMAAGYVDENIKFPNGTPSKRVVIDLGEPYDMRVGNVYRPSTNWVQGGPIIEREGLAFYAGNKSKWWAGAYGQGYSHEGPTPLIAAMRCFVASKLGEEIEIPEELK